MFVVVTKLLHRFNGLYFQDNLDKLAPERRTILDFNKARDDGVVVASAHAVFSQAIMLPLNLSVVFFIIVQWKCAYYCHSYYFLTYCRRELTML